MDKLGRLMSPDLPQMIEPLRFAKAGKQLSGQYDLCVMERLCALLYENTGQVLFKLKFGRDEEKAFYYITGQVESCMLIPCQRCFEGLEVRVINPIKLGIVSDKVQAEKLPADYEPLMLTNDSVSLLELIEDELLLAMPIAAMHDERQCPASIYLEKQIDDGKTGSTKNRPFASLEKFKMRLRK